MRSVLTLHLRQAARGLRRNPTFTTAVLLTLALAIGANTAVFSVVNGVLINPLPYPEPESLISVLTRAPGAPNAPGASGGIADMPESASMYVTYSENNRSFESLGVFQPFPLTVTGADVQNRYVASPSPKACSRHCACRRCWGAPSPTRTITPADLTSSSSGGATGSGDSAATPSLSAGR